MKLPTPERTLRLASAESDLQKQEVDVSTLRATLQAAMQEVDQSGSLLSEFRSLALPQSLDLKLTDLQEIIKEILASEKIAYRAAGITVKTDFDSSFSPINIDSAKIKQVVLNLCKNAIEAMRDGGLTVKVYRSRPWWCWKSVIPASERSSAWHEYIRVIQNHQVRWQWLGTSHRAADCLSPQWHHRLHNRGRPWDDI